MVISWITALIYLCKDMICPRIWNEVRGKVVQTAKFRDQKDYRQAALWNSVDWGYHCTEHHLIVVIMVKASSHYVMIIVNDTEQRNLW